MKKIISLSLALAVIFSLVGILPVEAKLYADYPFVYEPFEEDNLANQQVEGLISSGGGTSFKWSADGAGGSKGSISVTEAGNYSHMHFPINNNSMIAGQKIRYSCWIKPVDIDFNNKKVDFYIYGSSEKGTTGWNTASVSNVALKQGEWVYVQTEKIWDGSLYNNNATATEGSMNFSCDITKSMHVEIRVGSGETAKEVPKDSGKTSLTYLLDDVIVEPVNDKSESASTSENGLYKGSALDEQADTSAWQKEGTGPVLEMANEKGPDGSPNYMIVRGPDSGEKVWMEIKQKVAVESNHLYKVKFWAKINSADKGGFWFLGWTGANKLDFPQYAGRSDTSALTKEWKYFELYMFADHKAVEKQTVNWGIRFFDTPANQHITHANASYSIDSFDIIDMGIVANGDFETSSLPEGVYFKEGKANTDYYKQSAVPFWFENGAKVTQSNEVRPISTYPEGETTYSTKSMLVNTTSQGGYAFQPINIANQVQYKISFWAKGNNLAENQPIQLRLDRTVDSKEAMDAYEVPDEEILDKGGMLTNDWEKYEFIYSPVFTAEGKPASNIIPRLPYLNLIVGGNAAGISYFLDDFKIEEYDPTVDPDANKYQFPYAKDVSFSGDEAAGTTMTVDYEFVSDRKECMEGGSVVRLLKKAGDGWVTLAMNETNWTNAEIDIPNDAAGCDIKIEFVPIDEDGLFGTVYSYEIKNVKKAFDVTPSFTKWDETTGEIATSTHIENNSYSLGEQDMVLILAQYDKNGAMVQVDSKPVKVNVGFSENVAFSTVAAADAKSARMFVWSGTTIEDAGERVYSDSVSYTK